MSLNSNKFPDDIDFFPPVEESSRLLVGCNREDYSASRIARAVEDCDAHLLNLNVTSMGESALDDSGDLRVSNRNAAGIGRSLERYGYTVLGMRSADTVDADTARSRIDQLFRYLEI